MVISEYRRESQRQSCAPEAAGTGNVSHYSHLIRWDSYVECST